MINKSIDLSIYPSDFKEADLSPVFEKYDNLNKLNFCPISLLKVKSKIHEGMLSEQLSDHFYGILADRVNLIRVVFKIYSQGKKLHITYLIIRY